MPCPGHRRTQLLGGDPGRVHLGHQPAAQDHLDPVGHAEQLVEVGGDQQHPHPGLLGRADVRPDGRLSADVDPTGGVRRDQHHRRVAHLPAHDELLLIAAGQRRRGHLDARGPHVEIGDDPAGVPPGTAAVQQRTPAVRRLRLVPEHPVLPQRGLQQQGLTLSVLGDEAQPGLATAAGAPRADIAQRAGRVCDLHPTAGRPHTQDGVDQLSLAVALHPGQPQYLTGPHGQRHPVHHRSGTHAVGPHGEFRQLQSHPLGDGAGAGTGGGQVAADHQLRQLAAGDLPRRHRRHGGATAHHGDLVGHRAHLVQLVADEHHGQALGGQLTQIGEQLLDLLGHQHRSRLVEDDDGGPSVEDLEDLHPLPVPTPRRSTSWPGGSVMP